MNQEKIGMFIAECRKRKNLTQEELASIIGVSNRTISKWENGNCMPDYSVLPLLSKTLDITINELLSGEKLNEENYQPKLEENLILNMAELKKRTKKTVSFIMKIMILFLLLLLLTIILEKITNDYSYHKTYLSNENLNIKLCKENNNINITIESKDNKPILIEEIFDTKKMNYIVKPYRIRKKEYMKNDPYVYSLSIQNTSDIHHILIADKEFYKVDSNIEECQN